VRCPLSLSLSYVHRVIPALTRCTRFSSARGCAVHCVLNDARQSATACTAQDSLT
jgi:hypothetical protein